MGGLGSYRLTNSDKIRHVRNTIGKRRVFVRGQAWPISKGGAPAGQPHNASRGLSAIVDFLVLINACGAL